MRLQEDAAREKNWKRWGPYLSERQWGTVREDYSPSGDCWSYFPHDHARSRAYRWGEDGLLGITDRECRLCFAVALWNERDPILKERLFGLTGPEGNHGEDVKELYYYLDSTPTHSYMRALYKYPQAEFPYARFVDDARRRTKKDPEIDPLEMGIFDDDRYFDVQAEYAKAAPDDVLIRLAITNRGPDAAPLHVLPTLWFRNTWSWGRTGEGYTQRPRIARTSGLNVVTDHPSLGRLALVAEPLASPALVRPAELLFTENETNYERLFRGSNASPYVKDAFHACIIGSDEGAVNPALEGSKSAAWYRLNIPAGSSVVLKLRLAPEEDMPKEPFGKSFDATFDTRVHEADGFHDHLMPPHLSDEQRSVVRQAQAGLLWSKQFYWFVVKDWLEGDPTNPPPPSSRATGRNADWGHLYNRDVLVMPDKWEYPWYAAWDHAFHAVALAKADPDLAKQQLLLLLREWYMHPNGQIPAYEFAFSDVNPPVHAWACWRVYKMTGPRGQRDKLFLARCFQKLLLNFTWWVNRKDSAGRHIFGGGFLGLDNVGVFDRSRPLPTGGHLDQADGTAWMAFYALSMLAMALELADGDASYEDMASKFFEHFVAISDAANRIGGLGLWDETDGFYYDQLAIDGRRIPVRLRSMVGLVPLFAVMKLEESDIRHLPGFAKRLQWFLRNRPDLARQVSGVSTGPDGGEHRLLALVSRDRLVRVMQRVLDEREFLSPHGIRSLSAAYRDEPLRLQVEGQEWTVRYAPGESDTGLFGGNSNWRGPIWLPMNYLVIEALERFHHFHGDDVKVELPTGSGQHVTLLEASREISRRLATLFLPDTTGHRPCHGDEHVYATNPSFRDLVLFHEHFHGDTGRGLGASHQTGWTALIARLICDVGES